MNIKNIISILAVSLIMPKGFAQESSSSLEEPADQKIPLRIEDCYSGKNYPKRLYDIQWIPESYKISYSQRGKLFIQNVYSLKIDSSISISLINEGFMGKSLGLKRLPSLTWVDETRFRFFHQGDLYTYDIITKETKLKRKIGKFEVVDVHPSKLNAAAIIDKNLMVFTGNGKTQISSDGGNGIVYGQAVHRSEFGITKGLFWSNGGAKIAFYRKDERRVKDINELDISNTPATRRSFKYPFAGDSSHSVKVGVYNLLRDETIYLDIKAPYDSYQTNIAWDKEDRFVFIAEVNRDQNRMALKKYDARTGAYLKTLFTEANDRYVEPENPPLFLPDGNGFLWQSEKDGYNHIYWYDKRGKEHQVTKGNWVVTKIIGFDKSGKGVYFESTGESPLERHVYHASITKANPNIKKLTAGKGTHGVTFNTAMTLFLDNFTSTRVPRSYSILKMDGTLVNTILNSPNPIAKYDLGRMEIHPIIKNGLALFTRTYYPPGFDRNLKYPAIVYVYGGPHAQMIRESWMGGGNLWFYYMAQNGYIVHTIDNRGSANRGFAFESIIHRKLGTHEMEDQVYAVNQLKRLPYIDGNRIGVHGWSFGGFMTTSLMSRYPGIYKVGVAGGPVIDWKMYEIMYGERYMDRPSQNKEGYKQANVLTHVNNLDGRLLMIHGMDDNVVVWQHSLNYLKANISSGRDNLDYFFYPGHQHNVYGRDRIHLYKKVSQYFFEHL
mgnify:FL=1